MKYTEYGLKITISELRELLTAVERKAEYADKQESIYIEGGDKPKIIQYSVYGDGAPTDHTFGVKEER